MTILTLLSSTHIVQLPIDHSVPLQAAAIVYNADDNQ